MDRKDATKFRGKLPSKFPNDGRGYLDQFRATEARRDFSGDAPIEDHRQGPGLLGVREDGARVGVEGCDRANPA